MKNLLRNLKKSLSPALAGMWAMIMLTMIGNKVNGQTYAKYSMDSLTNFQTLYPCKSSADMLIFYRPAAFTSGLFHWDCAIPPYAFYADSLLIPNDYNSYAGGTGISCYSGNSLPNKTVDITFISSPIPVLHDTTLCGIINYTLNAGNDTGCTYAWNTSVITQSITITQSGIYWVDITNTCKTIRDSVVISDNDTHPPVLHDTSFCLGGSAILDPGTYTNYVWSIGVTSPTISITQSGTYAVTVTDNGCTDTTSAVVTVIKPYEGQEICYVSFDTLLYKNRINWKQHFGVAIDSVEIIKETAQNMWTPIGMVPNADSSFVDAASTPQSNSDSYRILIVDSCGNTSDTSLYHRTMTLVVSSFSDTSQVDIGFTWNNYEGVSVGTYTLYGIQTGGQINPIATNLVPAPINQMNLYNWSAASNPYIKFFVGFYWSCAKNQNQVRSNYLSSPTGINEHAYADQINVYPTLTNGPVNIATNLSITDIKVYNALGQVVLVTKDKSFNIQNKGIYFVDIQTNQGSIIQKVVVQ
jgi:hypothetical protein